MTRQSISLTDPNDAWLMAQVESAEYASKSDVVNDLIRRAREVEQQRELIRAKLIKAEQSGFAAPDREGLLSKIKSKSKPIKHGSV
jgi:antitoxin ParD1/3/4